jgi:hypothetical protein
MLAGLSHVIWPRLIELYRRHITSTDPLGDGESVHLVPRLLLDVSTSRRLDVSTALDSLAHDVKRRAHAGQDDIIRALDYILRDEVFHVRSGMRWATYLIGDDRRAILQERYEAWTCYTTKADALRARFVDDNPEKAMEELVVIEDGKRRRGGKPPDRPLNRIGRLQAGLNDDDILQVLSWGYATEAPPSEPT